ncbi:UDP-glycosyltransferase 73E1-like [Salvia miltiorrhiza]|uniref:UDP-glycosyltransferase 73E1-like n=1 Tax=Salvia miltiorrhiza TaxID=226208 RepID=UPI0025ABD2A4|nr:UDP-glycosyltransferase 73E1-like [Salvia miltiorrhiza]
MAEETQELHFLLFPLMSHSHIIPFIDFAMLLAQRGIIVSIITTPLNFTRYQPAIRDAVEAGLKLRMIPLEFRAEEAGLPQGCENLDSVGSMDGILKFLCACEMLAAPLQKLMPDLHPKPSCIVASVVFPWTDRFNIPMYIFNPNSCFSLFCCLLISPGLPAPPDSEPFVVPDIPHKIEFSAAQFSMIMNLKKPGRSSARGTVANCFEEMEGGYVDRYAKVAGSTVWCIGPVSLCNKKSKDEYNYISWLDSKKEGSVMYVCFGSLSRISAEQIKEIGLGLEASGFPFVWIVRDDSQVEVEEWLGDIEERVGDRGLIIRGWAPQVLLLSHPSVGGFLTHCGWNSTLEGVSAGVPMITWPMFFEQFVNEKLVVNVLKVGVEIGAEPPREDQTRELVKWDRVKEAIEKLMDGDEQGRERRTRSKKLAEMAAQALEPHGSSYKNISLFIQDVISTKVSPKPH